MSEFGRRLVIRLVGVAAVLAVMGYILAEVFLTFSRMNGGVADIDNSSVRWRTPLTMAIIGIVFQLVIEAIVFSLRRKKAAPGGDANQLTDSPTQPPSGPTT